MKKTLTVSFALISLLLFFPQSYVFLFPGLFVIFSQNISFFDRKNIFKAIGNMIIFSFAFWVIAYWLLMFIPIKLTQLFYLTNIIFLAIFISKIVRCHIPAFEWNSDDDWFLLIGFAGVCLTRFVPFFDRITGSVGDMTQHNYMTHIIAINNGFAKTYEPVLPFVHFGEYPPGFHTLCALITLLGKMPFYRVTNFVSCVIYFLLNLSLFGMLSNFFSKRLSFVTSTIVLYLSHYPQFLNQWGSSTAALSTTFLFFAYSFADENKSLIEQIAVGGIIAAGFLSHLVVPVGFAIYFPAYLLIDTLIRRQRSFGQVIRDHIVAVVSAVIFLIPFALNFSPDTFSQSKPAIAHGHIASLARILQSFQIPTKVLQPFADASILFSFIFGPVFIALSFFAILFVFFVNRRAPSKENRLFLLTGLGYLLLFFILLMFFQHRITLFYHLFQTERIHYFILIPAALILASAFQLLTNHRTVLSIVAIIFLSFTFLNYRNLKKHDFMSHYTIFKNDRNLFRFISRDFFLGSYFSYALDHVNASVTPSDIAAFEWVKQNVDNESVFATNYGDAGSLINSIAGRKTFFVHGMDLWHPKEYEQWQQSHPATHIYVGKPNPQYPTIYKREELDAAPGKYDKIYDQNGIAIYRIKLAF